jgi:hypothetical protein
MANNNNKKKIINLEPLKKESDKKATFKLRNYEVDCLKQYYIRPIDYVVDEKDLDSGELTDYAHFADDLPRLEEKAKILKGKGYKYTIIKLFGDGK